MTELAAGAVSSLLLVVRNEQLLLGGVKDDVQFIKEEMESMKSFLAHLARSTPPGREHDEQVRTWMNQVRLLAQDCHNCIELYLYSGNPDIHRTKGRLRRYLWWVYWFLRKLLAQHRAAVQLRQLKDRARDVGERRLRYGVEVPSKSAAGQSPPVAMLTSAASSSAVAGGYATGDDEEDGDDDQLAVGERATSTDHSTQPRALFSRSFDDYVMAKILEWRNLTRGVAGETMSFVMVAPDKVRDIITLVRENSVFQDPGFEYQSGYDLAVLIDIPALHMESLPLGTKEVLFYILRQLKLELQSQSQSQKEGTDQVEGEEQLCIRKKKRIKNEKEMALYNIKKNIQKMKICEKLDEIKSGLKAQPLKARPPKRGKLEDTDDKDVHVRLQQLLRSYVPASQQDQLIENKDMPKLPATDDIIAVAKKLKEHMEADERGGEGGDGRVGRGVEKDAVQEGEEGEGGRKRRKKENLQEEGREGAATDDNFAKKTKEHMEADEQGGEGGDGRVGRGVEKDAVQEGEGGGKGEVRRKVENKAVQEEGREGGEEHESGGGGEIVEERGGGETVEEQGGRGEILEEKLGGVGNNENENDDKKKKEKIAPIYLHEHQYIHILRQVFPKISSSNKSSSKQATETTLGEDQIKQQMIDEPKQEMLLEPQEGKHDKKGPNTENIFTKIVDQKMDKMEQEFKEQLKIKGLVDDIKRQLDNKCPLFILKINETVDLPRWEDTRNALTLLGCSADVLIVTTAKDIQQAKKYCYPPSEPIQLQYSLAGFYHLTVLEITKQQKNEENYDPQIFRNILEQCEPNEFCMKIFTHALYVNPKRSNEELNKLYKNLQAFLSTKKNLQASPESFNIIAKKMFKFSYTDLPKEYKSCFLYLAIFSPGYKIRRSTLIGRWVAEGLISKEDWASSVDWANRCLDELISRCLVNPAETGAAGKVKSCVVDHLVHGFITEIARKQHMVETRLSHHLARHFSIFNDLQLRSSDKIDGFFQRLSKSSRVSLIKVLDLEGCQCFGGKNQRYLEDICSKMLLLKYLSLRGTNITQLPSKINNLRELEVLDIRQTNVPMNATANVLLLKLKRLLAGNTDRAEESVSTAVQIPYKIEKMVNMEVLSNVEARSSRDLKDIGKLWQLRKLGVVVNNNSRYLKNLLRVISDLHECLCSLSITLPTATSQELTEVSLKLKLKHQPKLLESLSISGTTQKEFLPLFVKEVNNLVKVTLSSTSLINQNNLKDLARLPKLQFIRLRHVTDIDSLVFEQNEFISLKYLLVEGSTVTKVRFMKGAASMLEKMALSFTNIESVSGVDGLQRLEDVELRMSSSNKNNDTLLSSFITGKQTMAKLTIVSTSLEQGDQEPKITFEKGEFQKLKLLTVDYSAKTDVVFTSGCAPKLEKIVWSSSSTSLSGIDNLPKLMELEFNGNLVPGKVKEDSKKHKNKPYLKHNKPEIQHQEKGDEQEDDDDDAARFPLFCWKKQV